MYRPLHVSDADPAPITAYGPGKVPCGGSMRMPSILPLAFTSACLLYRKIPGNAFSTSLSASARSDDKTVIFNAGGRASPGGRFLGLVSLGRLSTLSGRQLSAPASKFLSLPLVAASF